MDSEPPRNAFGSSSRLRWFRGIPFRASVRRSEVPLIASGIRDNDPARVREAFEFIGAWNRSNPDMPLAISGTSLRRTLALNGLPLNQRNLLLLPKALRGGSESMRELYGTDR